MEDKKCEECGLIMSEKAFAYGRGLCQVHMDANVE
jgi:hypothetical protein